MSYCSSVINRARQTQQTEGAEFRYRYARKTLWAAFEPIIGQAPELVQELRAIIPEELHREREKGRQANRDRVKEGRRKKYGPKHSDQDQLKRQVRKMLSQGMTQQHIAGQLGVTQGRVSQIKQAMTKKMAKASNHGG